MSRWSSWSRLHVIVEGMRNVQCMWPVSPVTQQEGTQNAKDRAVPPGEDRKARLPAWVAAKLTLHAELCLRRHVLVPG